jgi:hypothetical protein
MVVARHSVDAAQMLASDEPMMLDRVIVEKLSMPRRT